MKLQRTFIGVLTLIPAVLLAGCQRSTPSTTSTAIQTNTDVDTTEATIEETSEPPVQPTYSFATRSKGNENEHSRVFYEVFVRAFADSNGDGIGDFNGLASKLDYLKDLGIDGLWLMPINESPSYHGYDVTDLTKLNSDYGTEEDFKHLLEEAHKRDIMIVMDFVVNHTSKEHPWFLSATTEADSPYKDYYHIVSADDTDAYSTTAQSPWNTNVWHSLDDQYYYGIFDSTMPDLNFENQEVRDEIKKAASKWLEMGVDGYRLDAAIHIYGNHEYENIDQVAKNIEWWNDFALACEAINPNVYLVGEAWDGNALCPEYVQPFDTKFDFTIQDDLLNAIKNKLSVNVYGKDLAVSIKETLDAYAAIDTNYQNGIFIGNHDKDRVMSQLMVSNRVCLLTNIFLTLPGNPYIYYGDELGMMGAKPDEFIRLDFKWTDDSTIAPHTNWYSKETDVNDKVPSLESQMNDPASIYNAYKTILNLRKNHIALSDGDFLPLTISDNKILAYSRAKDDEKLYLFHNLSSKPITIELDSVPELSGVTLANTVFSSDETASLEGNTLTLPKYTTIILSE